MSSEYYFVRTENDILNANEKLLLKFDILSNNVFILANPLQIWMPDPVIREAVSRSFTNFATFLSPTVNEMLLFLWYLLKMGNFMKLVIGCSERLNLKIKYFSPIPQLWNIRIELGFIFTILIKVGDTFLDQLESYSKV